WGACGGDQAVGRRRRQRSGEWKTKAERSSACQSIHPQCSCRRWWRHMNHDRFGHLPDERGYFGQFGGRFVPETLISALDELLIAYQAARNDPEFQQQMADLQATYIGRPTPLTYARRLSEHLGGAQIYLKREDLAHTGAHKINNALGQALLAQ